MGAATMRPVTGDSSSTRFRRQTSKRTNGPRDKLVDIHINQSPAFAAAAAAAA